MPANVQTMFSVGEAPWHKIGKVLDKNLTSAEAIKEAGLDWEVKKVPIYHKVGDRTIVIPGQFATVRQDTEEALGIVGNSYQVFQNQDAFSFMDAVMQTKEAVYETAGCLGNGSRVWMLAKIEGVLRVKDTDDVVDKYFLIYTSHDGSLLINTALTTVRVVCQNTANIAIKEAKNVGKLFKIRHTKKVGEKVAEAREALGIVNNWYHELNDAINAMADFRMNTKRVDEFIGSLGMDVEAEAGRAKATVEKIKELFASGKGNKMQGIKGSLWAMVNGVTEYVDHYRPTRKTNNFQSEEEARLNSAWFSSGATLKDRAYDKALQLVKAA